MGPHPGSQTGTTDPERWSEWSGRMRWAMAINLRRCTGCYACTIACQQEHFNPPGIFWNRLMILESGAHPIPMIQIYPVLCNHCREAICVKACPAGATHQRADGIVWIDQDRCVGCRYCIVACPYQARSYNREKKYLGLVQSLTEFGRLGKEIFPHQDGVAEKCNYCMEKIDAGLAQGLRPGADRDATPACVNTCPTTARHFGDLDDPLSEVSIIIRERKGVPFHPEFGTDPCTFYYLD